jgi:hypothetical protein
MAADPCRNEGQEIDCEEAAAEEGCAAETLGTDAAWCTEALACSIWASRKGAWSLEEGWWMGAVKDEIWDPS